MLETLTQPDLARPQTVDALAGQGYVLLSAARLAAATGVDVQALAALTPAWERLPADRYLRDGGHYRSRRHSCYVQEFAPPGLGAVAHRAHWQPTTYNALHGGLERWFEPIQPEIATQEVWRALLSALGELFAQVRRVDRWYIEAHQFRIDTAGGIGRPTPEGAHRDGVDFVAVILVARQDVRGGETRVFESDGPAGTRFTMHEPWSALLMDDSRVIHETTPIQPEGASGHRDTLVLTYRAGGFQSRETDPG
jgi:hypothetical protein